MKKPTKVFPGDYKTLETFLEETNLNHKVEELIASTKEAYMKKYMDKSYTHIAHDGIWNSIAREIEIISSNNQ
tara:strand:- start:599 stop:817 length:219 start_codon:yes stop_codon:yes gene_type:complete